MIPELKDGEPIDYTLINKMISRLNALDDADKFTALASRNVKYKSTEDKIIVQGFRKTMKLTRNAAGYYGSIGTVAFPEPFADVPVVTITFDSSTYMVPYITSISTAGFALSGLRASASDADAPVTVNFNVIAIGASRT